MSYLKLDATNIRITNSNTTTKGDIILSQVIDSYTGPENPILISSLEDLNIYFGKSFTSRNFFEELFSNFNISLLLTKPFKSTEISEVPEIDISDYEEVFTIMLEDELEYPIASEELLPEIGEENKKYYVLDKSEYFIWTKDYNWISESNIPLVEVKSSSNRDTLRIVDKDWYKKYGLSWCCPKYSTMDYTPIYEEEPDEESLLQSIKTNSFDYLDENSSIGFVLDFSNVSEIKDGDYLIIPASESRKIQFYSSSVLSPDIISSETVNFKIEGESLDEKIEMIISKLKDYDWRVEKTDIKNRFKLYTKDIIKDYKFYNISGLIFDKDLETTYNIISVLTENNKRAEFFSKTLGPGDEDITIQISKIDGKEEWYRIIVKRYDYQEVFEGPLYIEPDETYENQYNFLENSINQTSKLITVKFYNSDRSKENSKDGLIEGTYTLSRSKKDDTYTPEDFWRGFEKLKDYDISEDFLLLPDIENFLITGVTKDSTWYSEYKTFLDYGNSKNCQILISNHPYYFGCTNKIINLDEALNEQPTNPNEEFLYLIKNGEYIDIEKYENNKWNILGSTNPDNFGRWPEIKETFSTGYTGNQIFNLTTDKDNRLVYFYKDLTLYGLERPGYYVFLRGILSNVYSLTVDEISYESPDEYYSEDKVDSLEKYKSNYLSYNGHTYYYKKFFSHTGDWKYITTILTRFCMDKVTNTIKRDFPSYLGETRTGDIVNGFKGILSSLKSRFPIIYSLNLDYIEEDQENQKFFVYLNLKIKELVDKNVNLSVTLNFNNN